MTDSPRPITAFVPAPPAEGRPGVSDYLLAMGHELRAPLNAVIGMSGLLLDGELSSRQRQYVRSINAAGESLSTILADLLDLSRLLAGGLPIEPIPFDLRSMVEETAKVLSPRAEERNLALRVDWRPEIGRHVVGDPGRTRQVLGNLVGHALNATSQGEVVILVSADGEQDGVPMVRFSVEDTGIGIPAERVSRVFDDYVPVDASPYRSFGITGLGLRISAELVRLMNGEIGVISELEKGSKVWFRLPMPTAAAGQDLRLDVAMPTGGRILIVEADPASRRRLSDQLEEAGWSASFADDLNQVYDRLLEAAGGAAPFTACLLSDYAVRPAHAELAMRIKANERLGSVALAILTAVGSPGEGKRLWHAGFAAYLRKPVPTEELHDALTALAQVAADGRGPSLITRHSLAEARNSAPAEFEGIDAMLASLTAPETARALLIGATPAQQLDVTEALALAGLAVEMAATPESALERIDRTSPAIVFAAGDEAWEPEAFSRLREALGASSDRRPIVAFAADPGRREALLAIGVDEVLLLPVRRSDLDRVVRRWAEPAKDDAETAAPTEATIDAPDLPPIAPATEAMTPIESEAQAPDLPPDPPVSAVTGFEIGLGPEPADVAPDAPVHAEAATQPDPSETVIAAHLGLEIEADLAASAIEPAAETTDLRQVEPGVVEPEPQPSLEIGLDIEPVAGFEAADPVEIDQPAPPTGFDRLDTVEASQLDIPPAPGFEGADFSAPDDQQSIEGLLDNGLGVDPRDDAEIESLSVAPPGAGLAPADDALVAETPVLPPGADLEPSARVVRPHEIAPDRSPEPPAGPMPTSASLAPQLGEELELTRSEPVALLAPPPDPTERSEPVEPRAELAPEPAAPEPVTGPGTADDSATMIPDSDDPPLGYEVSTMTIVLPPSEPGEPAVRTPARGKALIVEERPAERLPIVGEAILEQLSAGSGIFAQQVVGSFLRDAPQRISELATAAARRDLGRMGQALQSLKAMGGLLGAAQLVDDCFTVEADVERGDFENAAGRLGEIEHAFLEVRAALEKAAPPGAAAPSELPPVSGAFLDQLSPAQDPGSRALAEQLAGTFRAEAPERLSELKQAVIAEDAEKAQRLAQTLKGMCGLIGADAMAKLCALVEADARLRRVGQARRYLDQLVLELERVRDALTPAG